MRIPLSLALLSWAFGSQAQQPLPPAAAAPQLRVTYRVTYQPDSTSTATQSEDMQLLIGPTLSRFTSVGQRAADSITAVASRLADTPANAQLLGKIIMSKPRSAFKYTIFKHPASGQLYCYDQVGPEMYRYDEPIALLAWTIDDATATVAGYACQRATTSYAGRQYEAWFTRDVPVSDGPYKFAGLPGLVVKVADTRRHYAFELTNLTRLPQPEPVDLPAEPVKRTTKLKLRRAQQTYALTLQDKIIAAGHPLSVEERQAYQQKIRSRNNPLELR